MYPTSDRLQTRLITSGATRSTPVWRLNRSLTQIASVLPDAVTPYRLPRSFNWKGQENVLDCTGAGCGPYKNYRSEPGAKDEPNKYFAPDQKKGSENWSSRFEPKISLGIKRGEDTLMNKVCCRVSREAHERDRFTNEIGSRTR